MKLPKIIALTIVLCHFLSAEEKSLSLSEIEKSVLNHYPPYLLAQIEHDIAAGKLTEAKGQFDPKLSSFANVGFEGFYDGDIYGLKIEGRQDEGPLRFYSGYRLSEGDLPSYEKGRTAAGGQVVLGMALPLLRNNSVDEERLKLKAANLTGKQVQPIIDYQRIHLIEKARKAYFNWLGAGYQLKSSEDILKLAELRDEFLKRKIAAGQLAQVTALDNKRILIKRRLEVNKAKAKLQASAIELSLYLRDKEGVMQLPERAHLPNSFPELKFYSDDQQLTQLISKAFQRRPELKANSLELQQEEIKRDVAKNNFQPQLDLRVESAFNVGSPSGYKDRDQNDLRAGIHFSIPLSRRKAKGRLMVAKGKVSKLRIKERFIKDKLRALVRTKLNEHLRANEQLKLAQHNEELAKQLSQKESQRFQSGASDLLSLQIREKYYFEAQLLAIEANVKLFKSWVEVQSAVGLPSS